MGEPSREAAGAQVAALAARIDRLPGWGMSWGVFVMVGLSYFFAFYDITAISYTLPELTRLWHLSEAELAYPVTLNLVGYMVGALTLGMVADRVGRRPALLATVAVLTAGGLLAALAWDIWSLTAFRFVTGLGVGAEIALAATIVTESSPSVRRGRYMQLTYLWGACAFAVTPFVALRLLALPGGNGWRLVFGVGAVVAVLMLFMRRRRLPESPRWLVLHGRGGTAERLVAAMEARCQARSGAELPPVVARPPEDESRATVPVNELLRPPYLRRVAIVFGFWLTWYIATYAYLGYFPTILIRMGLSEASGLLTSALSALAFPIGGVVALLLVDRAHRSHLMAAIAVVFAAGLALVATGPGPALVFVGGLVGALAIAANSVGYLYTAETFPTRARATALSLADGVGHLGGVIGPIIVVAALGGLGGGGALWVLVGTLLVAAVVIGVGGTRTAGRGLTEIAR
jgi:MFS transporter, putative metabolite:H+ symporter